MCLTKSSPPCNYAKENRSARRKPLPGALHLRGSAMVVATICRAPGCDELALSGGSRCEEHAATRQVEQAARRQAAKRGSSGWSHLYQTREWKDGRKAQLKAHPLCRECEAIGLVVGANEVDHIVPHRGNRKLFRDRTNWQSLCRPCHSRKTAREVLQARRKAGGEGLAPDRPAGNRAMENTFCAGDFGEKSHGETVAGMSAAAPGLVKGPTR